MPLKSSKPHGLGFLSDKATVFECQPLYGTEPEPVNISGNFLASHSSVLRKIIADQMEEKEKERKEGKISVKDKECDTIILKEMERDTFICFVEFAMRGTYCVPEAVRLGDEKFLEKNEIGDFIRSVLIRHIKVCMFAGEYKVPDLLSQAKWRLYRTFYDLRKQAAKCDSIVKNQLHPAVLSAISFIYDHKCTSNDTLVQIRSFAADHCALAGKDLQFINMQAQNLFNKLFFDVHEFSMRMVSTMTEEITHPTLPDEGGDEEEENPRESRARKMSYKYGLCGEFQPHEDKKTGVINHPVEFQARQDTHLLESVLRKRDERMISVMDLVAQVKGSTAKIQDLQDEEKKAE